MSILHRRRAVKRRWLEREACGERRSAPHEYPRASEKDVEAVETVVAERAAVRTARAATKRPRKKKRRAPRKAVAGDL